MTDQKQDEVKDLFEESIKKLSAMLGLPGINMAIVIVSEPGGRLRAGCAGAPIDIITSLNAGIDLIAATLKESVGTGNNNQ